jgi:hypothetical protein
VASVTSVRIPREAIPVLERVVDLDEPHLTALVGALSTGNVRDLSALKAAVIHAVGDVWPEQEEIEIFVGHLMSMLALGGTHNIDTAELVGLITEKATGPRLEQDGVKESLSSRLTALLSARDLVAFSKASDIATEYDHLLHLSRIVTDIRPVFGIDACEEPVGAVVVHTLRIDYFEGNRLRSISFAMDSDDLSNFKKIVERAADKQNSLSRTLQKAGLPEFDITAGEIK